MTKPGNAIKTLLPSCSTWPEIEAVINELAAENPKLAQDTIENSRRLSRFASRRYQTPSEIVLGYLPTIRFCWSTPSIEIEVHETHYEFYWFSEGATDIQHMANTSGSFPEGLKVILDTAILQTPVVEGDS